MSRSQEFFAVKSGFKPGIYNSREDCMCQIRGFPYGDYRIFPTLNQARKYLNLPIVDDVVQSKMEVFNQEISIYTDGSYNKYKNKYSWSFVVYKDDVEMYYEAGVGRNKDARDLQNTAGEVEAVMRSLHWATTIRGYNKIILYHDFMGIELMVSRKSKPKHPYLIHFVEAIQKYTNRVRFCHISSHCGILGNEKADDLAYSVFSQKGGYLVGSV